MAEQLRPPAPPLTTRPPADQRAGRIVEEMFLSPRVVDEAAFSQYAGELRSLIAEAEQAARHLSDSAQDGRSLLTTLAPTTGRLRRSLEAAQRLARVVEERAAALDRSSQELAQTQRRLEAAQQALEKPLEERTAQLR
ncbi:MAG: hypothetical protein D6824_09800, partial [Planctomycetota bacterium]